MAKKQKFWLKERYNPQLGTYYIVVGRLPTVVARAAETGCLYGRNKMHPFDTEQQLNDRVTELQLQGNSIQ